MMTTFLEKHLNSRDKVDMAVSRLVTAVDEGEMDPLQLMIELKGLEEVIKKTRELIRDNALNELHKHGKEAQVNGSTLRVNTGRRHFDYKHSEKWQAKKLELETIEKEMKAAINHTIVDEDTGEIIQPARVRHSTEYISIEMP